MSEFSGEQSVEKDVKFTWKRITDPELAKDAKAALETFTQLDKCSLEADEVFIFPLSEAVKYYQEQEKILYRQTFGIEISIWDSVSPVLVNEAIHRLPLKGELAGKYNNGTLGSYSVSHKKTNALATAKKVLIAAGFAFLDDNTAIPPQTLDAA